MFRCSRVAASILLASAVTLAVGVAPAGAAVIAEYPICVDSGVQLSPAMYGNKVVWYDQQAAADAEIRVYDILSGVTSAVTSDTFNQARPDIYQDLVVYEDSRNGFMDVFITDLATGVEQQLTPAGTRQDHAAIWGETVVWRDQRNTTYDIYARSLSSGFESRLTANSFDQEAPDVWGDLVVYQDNRHGDWEIYAYDLSVGNESRITDQGADQTGPKVSDTLIAWTDMRLGSADVYAYDPATHTEFLVAGGASDQILQGVYGDRVVFLDDSLSTMFLYDRSTGVIGDLPVTDAADHLTAAVFGDNVAICGTGVGSGTWDLFMVTVDEIAPTTQIAGNPAGWASEPVTVTLTADDGLEGSGVAATYYALDGDPAVEYTGALVFATEGTTQLEYWSVDIAGNVEDAHSTLVRIDTLAPVTLSDIDSAWQEGPVLVTLTAGDGDGSGVQWTLYSVDGGALQPYLAPFWVSGDAEHVVTYMSADFLGHAEDIRTDYVRIDNTAPSTTSNIDPAWQDGPVSVSLTPADPYSGVASTFYSIDGSNPAIPYTGSFDITQEGTTTVKFYSVDALGHTESVVTEYVRIDNTAPSTTSNIDPAWQDGPVSVSLTPADPYSGVASTFYSIDGSNPAVPYTGAFDITQEGTTTVKFYSVDALGHTESVVTEYVRVDNTAPSTTSDIDSAWQIGPVEVTLSPSDQFSGVASTYYSLNGSFPTTLYSGSFSVSAEGTTTVKFYSVDVLGHVETVTTQIVRIDNIAPITTSNIDSNWRNGPATVSLAVVDAHSGPVSTFYSTDGSAPTVPYVGSFGISAEGTTTVKYYSVDAFGHVEGTKTQLVRIDNTAPVTTSDIDGAWQEGPVTVTLSPSDPHSGVAGTFYYIDGQAPARSYTGPFQITAQGATAVTYFSVDALGHVGGPITETVRIDNTAPVTTSDIDSAWQDGPVTVTLSPTDPYSGVAATYYSTDGSAPTVPYAGSFDIAQEGTTTVKFYSADAYGHVETVTTQLVRIDNTAPVTTSDIDGAWQEGPVTVTLSPTDPYSGVTTTYYYIDGPAPATPYTGSIQISAQGETDVTYYSIDALGHVEDPITETVRIDNTAPVTTSDIDSAWQEGPVTVTLSPTDPYSGVAATYYSTDGSAPSVPYAGSFDIAQEGTTTVKFYSVDAYGHVETVTTQLVRIDNTAPSTTSDAPADWQVSPVEVALTAFDAHSGVAVTYYSLDGSVPTVVYTTPITVSTEGTTTIKFYSVDVYGHSESVQTAIVRIDDTVPATESNIDSAWSNTAAVVTLSSNAEWIYYSTDGSDPTVPYTEPFAVSDEGTTTVKYRAETKSHVFEIIQSEDVRIDYEAPVTATGADTEFWDTAYLAVDATDALSGVAQTYVRVDGGVAQAISEITVTALGDHVIEFWSQDVAGNVETATVHDFAVLPSSTDYRVIAGTDRIATAISVSKTSHPDGADYVVLATGSNWPDALGGAALAGAYDAPILLVNGELTSAVEDEIRRLAPEKALILGGVGAMSEEIEARVREIVGVGAVERFWGNTRYETADAIAYRVLERMGAGYDGTAFVVTGEGYPDAVAASPMATANGWPVFLAGPTGLSQDSHKTMQDIGVNRVVVVGGEAVVPPAVMADLEGVFGAGNVTRLSGADRYATALAAARYGTTFGGLIWDGLAIATGQNFADALTGGVLQGLSGSTMVLTRSASLPADVDAELVARRDVIGSVTYLGGDSAVGPAVRSRVGQILR